MDNLTLRRLEGLVLVVLAVVQALGDRLLAALLASPAAAAGPALAALTVVQLRSLARERLGSAARVAGRRIAQARKADLLVVLGA